jgi:hypothetical protein
LQLTISSTSKVKGITKAEVISQLECFGEVCRLDLAQGSWSDGEKSVEVSFFDIRAAAAAKAELGDSCSYVSQYGQRQVRLLGAVGLETASIGGVSNISMTEDGDCIIDFFDTRTAAKSASNLNRANMPKVEACKEEVAPPTPKPCKVHDLRLSELRWDDLASNREWRTALQLRGLPSAMCETRAIKALLESNGLLDLVESVQATPSRGKFGHAIVNAKAVTGVGKLARFFHGKRFGSLVSIPVSVSFATVQGKGTKTDLKKRQKVKAPERDDIGSAFEWTRGTTELPWHVDTSCATPTCGSLSTMCDSAATDVSSDEAWPMSPPGL